MANKPPRTPADIFHNEATAWAVLAVSLVITLLASYITSENIQQRAEDRFAFEVEDARERITKRMLEYEQVLRGGVALFRTLGGAVSREQWHEYIKSLQIESYYPGIQGLGFAVMLQPDEVPEHIQTLRAQGFSDYTLTPAGDRDIYSAIIYLEPFDARNRRAFGYDMFSEPVRRAAMERARDTGLPAVSGRVILVQETGKDVQAGFLMYLPLYQPGLPTRTVAERRVALLGFVYSPFRIKDLMNGILGGGTPGLGFELFDGLAASALDRGLYVSDPVEKNGNSRLEPAHRTTTTVELPGRTWTARFHSRPEFDTSVESTQPLLVGFGGLTVDILLFTIIWSLVGEHKRVQRKAEAMTAELRKGATRLAESQNRLSFGEEMAGLGSLRWDTVSERQWWSDGFYRLLGVEPQVFAPSFEKLNTFLPAVAKEQVASAIQDLLTNGEPTALEHAIQRADGAERTLQLRCRPLHDRNGSVTGYVGTALDITERKRAEKALTVEHALMQSIIDSIPDLVVVKDTDLVYLSVNSKFLNFIGKPLDAVLGKTDYELFPKAEAEQYRRDDRALITTGQPLTLTEHVTGSTGQRWLQVAKVPLRNPEGDICGVLMSVRDISALKRTEEELRRKNAELEAVFAANHVQIAVMDRDFRFVQVNSAYAASSGFKKQHLIGRRHFDLFPDAENEAIFGEVIKTGEAFSVSAKPFKSSDIPDSVRYWDWTLSPLQAADGNVEGAILTLIDATEREQRRRTAEEAWRKAQAELEQRVFDRTRELEIANRELETFSYSVSHDLRGPLRAIDGFTQMLREDYGDQLDANGMNYIDRVNQATMRMAALIDGLLDLSRLSRSEVQATEVDLSSLAEEIFGLLRFEEPDREVHVEIASGLKVIGDPTLLRVVLQNLIENAWKFTAQCPSADILFGRYTDVDREVLFIRDSGVGFESEYADKLFQPFERLHAQDEFQGTGIGLATVRRIIQRHGGEVWADGKPGEGTTIYFTLKASSDGSHPPDSPARERPEVAGF